MHMFGKGKASGNPTGRERRSSAGTRRKKDRRLERDLEGTQWEKKDDDKGKGKK